MTTTTQGEHAQTEALRPKFGDLLRNTMASESNPRRDAYFIREVHRSGGGVNPGRWFEMTDGKGETWLSNPQNLVTAPTAQPAAPQGVAYAELRKEFDLWWNDQMGNEPGRDTSSDSRAFMPYKAWKEATNRASNGQAPAGATPCDFCLATGQAACKPDSAYPEERECAANNPTAQAAPAAGAVAGPDVKYALAHADTAADLLMRAHEQAPETWRGWYDDALVHIDIARKALAAAPTPAAKANSQPAPQGETNVQLDIDSNPPTPGQHRDMAGSVALGQPMGYGQDQASGHPGAQGDKLLTVAERNIRSFLRSAVFKSESDREAALSCVDVLRDAARAPADSVLEDAAPSKCSINRYCHANMCLETDADHETDCPQGHAARKQGDKHD